jgi:hypothetical protein
MRRYSAVPFVMALGVALALLGALVMVRESEAITFEPSLTASVSVDTAGAPADLTTEFKIPAGSAQFLAQATFTPPEFAVSAGADLPLGAIVGKLDANATLGLINGPCNSALPVSVDLMNATTDTSATVIFDDQFQDADANTLPDAVDKYPDFLTRMLPGVTPRARFFGQASVAGSAVSMNFVILEPGATIPVLGALDASWGYPSVSILNNNGDPGATAAPGAITDFCTPLSTTITTFATTKDNDATSADESGATVQTNPATGGTFTFRSRNVSQYDADDDNTENGLDTCPYAVNVGDYSVAGSGDQDNDGIDDVCDPNPTETKVDQDDDAYTNRGDNCPLVANGTDPDNQKDQDADSIGDACDTNPTTPDAGTASPVDVTVTSDVTIAGGAAATETVVSSPPAATATPATTATAAASPTKTATVAPTATPQPTATTVTVGGGGLLGGDDGFPAWAFVLVGMAAVLMLGGLGTAVTVRRRGK